LNRTLDNRAWPDLTVIKLADGDDLGVPRWQPATVRVQNHDLSVPDTYVLIAAIQLALAEAAKLDAQWPAGEVAKENPAP